MIKSGNGVMRWWYLVMHHGAMIGGASDVFEVTFVDDVFIAAGLVSRLVHVVSVIEGAAVLLVGADTS